MNKKRALSIVVPRLKLYYAIPKSTKLEKRNVFIHLKSSVHLNKIQSTRYVVHIGLVSIPVVLLVTVTVNVNVNVNTT